MDLRSLYNQVITEKSRSAEHRHPVDGCTVSLEGVNPSCGDDITLQLRVKDGVIEDVGFMGAGCAISQASASLMIDILKGKSVAEAKELIDIFFGMIKGEIGEDDERIELIEDAAALKGIARTPARVKCAVLAWHTMEEALDK